MNFELTKTEQLFRQMIREFAENEVKPLAAEIDEEERFPVFFVVFMHVSHHQVLPTGRLSTPYTSRFPYPHAFPKKFCRLL